MNALAKIKNAGFELNLAGDSIEVKPASKLNQQQREFLRFHKAELIAELKAIPAIPDAKNREKPENLVPPFVAGQENKPKSNDARDNVAEIAEPLEYENTLIGEKNALIKCHDCLHFKCFNQHGRGAGHCLVGGDYGLWSETLHQCEKFDAAVEWVYETDTITPGALIITCYTPAGNPIKVHATSPEHADWLSKMNPCRSTKP